MEKTKEKVKPKRKDLGEVFKNILQIGILTDAYKKALEKRKEHKNAK